MNNREVVERVASIRETLGTVYQGGKADVQHSKFLDAILLVLEEICLRLPENELSRPDEDAL